MTTTTTARARCAFAPMTHDEPAAYILTFARDHECVDYRAALVCVDCAARVRAQGTAPNPSPCSCGKRSHLRLTSARSL